MVLFRCKITNFSICSEAKQDLGQFSILNSSSSMIYCTVEDDGAGILPEQCEHLFDLYVRGNQSRHSVGLGLGLYLCRQIIGARGGGIWGICNSGGGGGFLFFFSLG